MLSSKEIENKLNKQLDIVYLSVIDESHHHEGHLENTNGTHFSIQIYAKEFEGKSTVDAHRLIYKVLEEEMRSQIHALRIEIKNNKSL